VVAACALLAIGCGSVTSSSGGGSGSQSTPSGGGTSQSGSGLPTHITKMALILSGKKTDPGYVGLGYQAFAAAAKKFGITQTVVAESVPTATQAQTFTQLAQTGYQLIIAWGGQFQPGAEQVGPKFPHTYFVVTQAQFTHGKNVTSADLQGQEWSFLDGFVAAKLSKSHTIGLINSNCFAETSLEEHGVKQGIKYVNPQTKTLVAANIGFDDPSGAKQAAEAQIAQGADILWVNLNTGNLGVYQAAEQAKSPVLVLTEIGDYYTQAPKVIVTSDVRDDGAVFDKILNEINSGQWTGQPVLVPMSSSDVGLTPFHGLAPASLYSQAKEIQKKILSGAIPVKRDTSCPF
jgi:basic membrane lipoprotein Med (substrate-binding protein (PBP1-ABC) superfamily)